MHLTSTCGAEIEIFKKESEKKELLYYEVKRKLCERYEPPITIRRN